MVIVAFVFLLTQKKVAPLGVYMRFLLITLTVLVPFCACYASRYEGMDDYMDKFHERMDRIDQNIERQDQRSMNRAIINEMARAREAEASKRRQANHNGGKRTI